MAASISIVFNFTGPCRFKGVERNSIHLPELVSVGEKVNKETKNSILSALRLLQSVFDDAFTSIPQFSGKVKKIYLCIKKNKNHLAKSVIACHH